MMMRLALGGLSGFIAAHLLVTLMPLALGYPFNLQNFLGARILEFPYAYIYWAGLGAVGAVPQTFDPSV